MQYRTPQCNQSVNLPSIQALSYSYHSSTACNCIRHCIQATQVLDTLALYVLHNLQVQYVVEDCRYSPWLIEYGVKHVLWAWHIFSCALQVPKCMFVCKFHPQTPPNCDYATKQSVGCSVQCNDISLNQYSYKSHPKGLSSYVSCDSVEHTSQSFQTLWWPCSHLSSVKAQVHWWR